MSWNVAIRTSVGSGLQRFALDVAFRSDAPRLALLGPSGAGKSLTLKAIAGLIRPDAGRIAVGGTTVFDAAAGLDVPAERRGLGLLFQEYALFPHLTVRQNVAFSRRRGWRNPSETHADADVDRALATFGLAEVATLHPHELSGGQRQRTALARTLVASPRALLLDEPFAALDAPLRRRLRTELVALQAGLGLPMLLITHDEEDVAAFGGDVVQIEAGRVRAPAVSGG
jgi:molybdate transport system ATP-binding protein